MNVKYTVINQKEPRGQSVVGNGIPYTSRLCATQLNELSRENEKLEKETTILKDKLKSINFVLKCYNSELNKDLFKENSLFEKVVIYEKLELLEKLKEEIEEIINEY